MKYLPIVLSLVAIVALALFLRTPITSTPLPVSNATRQPVMEVVHSPVPVVASQQRSLQINQVNHVISQQPPWVVPYGKEFWRQVGLISATGVNAGAVMDRCSHAFEKTAQGTAIAAGETFSLRASEEGLRFDVMGPKGNSETGLSLRTETVRVGEEIRRAPRTGYWVTGNTAQAPTAFNLIEHVETRQEGAALTWILNDRIDSDLEIGVRATGMAYAGETEHGIHFKDAKGVPRVRISHVTVVDSAGTRTQLPLRFENNRIAVDIPAQLLASAQYPVAIDPVLSAEFQMDKPVQSVASGSQYLARVAANGADWLVVWNDLRGADRIRGAVVDGGTNQLKTPASGIVVSDFVASADLEVTGNGTDWLVTWSRGFNAESKLYATVVNGTTYAPETPAGLSVCSLESEKKLAGIEAAGANWLIVWSDKRSGDVDVYGAIVNGTSNEVATAENGFLICSVTGEPKSISFAATGNEWLVGWQDERSGLADIYAAIIDGTSNTIETSQDGFVVCGQAGSQANPHVSSNGTDWLIVWDDLRPATSSKDIYGAVIRGSNHTFRSSEGGIQITNSVYDNEEAPRASAAGSNWLIIWQESSEVYGAVLNGQTLVKETSGNGFWLKLREDSNIKTQISSNGTDWLAVSASDALRASIIDGETYAVTPQNADYLNQPDNYIDYSFRIASNQTDWLVVWDDFRGQYTDVYGAVVSGSTGMIETAAYGVPLCLSANGQTEPKTAAVGADWLVVWLDQRNPNGSDLYGAVVNGTSGVIETSANGFPICTAAGNQESCEVSSNGTDWLVAWVDERNSIWNRIYYAVVNGATNRIETQADGIPLGGDGDQSLPCIATNRVDWLVAWASSTSDISATIVSGATNTVKISSPLPICSATGNQTTPQVAFIGSYWLVAWEDYRAGSVSAIYASVVDATTYAIKFGANGFKLSQGLYHNDHPRIAGKGADAMIVWTESQSGNYYNVWGAQILGSDILKYPYPSYSSGFITNASYNQRYPQVASNGARWLVVWQDYRSGTDWDIYGRVDGGSVFPITSEAGHQYDPQVAGASGHWAVSWETDDDGVQGAFVRANGTPTAVFDISGSSSYYSALAVNSAGKALAVSTPPRQDDSFRVVGRRIDPYVPISFPAIGKLEFSRNTIALNATSPAGSGFTFRIDAGAGYIYGNSLSLRGLGTFKVTVTHPGNSQFLPRSVTQTFQVVDTTPPKIDAKNRIRVGRVNSIKVPILCTDAFATKLVQVRVKGPGEKRFGKRKEYDYEPKWNNKLHASVLQVPVDVRDEGVTTVEVVAVDYSGNKSRPFTVRLIK